VPPARRALGPPTGRRGGEGSLGLRPCGDATTPMPMPRPLSTACRAKGGPEATGRAVVAPGAVVRRAFRDICVVVSVGLGTPPLPSPLAPRTHDPRIPTLHRLTQRPFSRAEVSSVRHTVWGGLSNAA
jgi:hypothetical protein